MTRPTPERLQEIRAIEEFPDEESMLIHEELLAEIDALQEWANVLEQSKKGDSNEIKELEKERDELKALLLELNRHVFPGECDSIDSLLAMYRERDQLKAELEAANQHVKIVNEARDQLKCELRGYQAAMAAVKEQNEKLKAENLRLIKETTHAVLNETESNEENEKLQKTLEAHWQLNSDMADSNQKLRERIEKLREALNAVAMYCQHVDGDNGEPCGCSTHMVIDLNKALAKDEALATDDLLVEG